MVLYTLLFICCQLFVCIEYIYTHPHETTSTERNMFSGELTITDTINQTNPLEDEADETQNGHKVGRKQKSMFDYQKTNKSQRVNAILPSDWQKFCSAEFKYVSGAGLNFTDQWAVYVSCDLGKDDHWSLSEYRKWILTNEKTIYNHLPIDSGLLFAFDFKCSDREGTLSLPRPIQGKYLWYLSANNCTMLDYLLEFNITNKEKDYLKVVEMIDCIQATKENLFFDFFQSPEKQSLTFYCKGEEMERYVFRNISTIFIGHHMETDVKIDRLKPQTTPSPGTKMPESVFPPMPGITPPLIPSEPDTKRAINESEMINAIAKFSQDQQKFHYRCNFKYFRYLDESYSHTVANHHTHLMTEKSQWPALEYFNMSQSRLRQLPAHYLEWRRYFPKMKYMDLSHNKIKYFSALNDNGLYSETKGVLDLRHNNITTLTFEDLEALRLHGRSVFVDIRDNPFICDCKITHFVDKAKNLSMEVFHMYKYLKNLTCASPPQYVGKTIALLDHDFCETMEMVFFAVPLVIVSCFTVLVIAIFILSIRYRREIIILAFTRFNVSLPCRQIMKNVDKKYDAFIAYSEHDGDWVFHTLLPRLEEPMENNGPGLKLCIHHRDFPVGGCIADNILDKVKDSRHTVLILSNNFLRSHWCKYEFKAAFTQSLMEKKQHLIMVIKEELDKLLIDSALKRCLKTFTFVKADDRLFWDKIIYALSDTAKNRDIDINYNIEENLNAEHRNKNAVGKHENRDNNADDVNDRVHIVNEGLNIRNIQENNAERVMYQNQVNMNQNGQNVQDGEWNI